MNKQTDEKRQINIWVKNSLYEQLQKKCDEKHTSMSQAIRSFLVEFVKEDK
jgi:hypothetical protein